MIPPLTDLAMGDIISKSHQRKEEEQMEPEEIIQDWVSIVIDETPTDDLRVGRDISPFPEIKIAFDGYAEGDDGDPEGGIWTSGQSQALIHDIPTCADMVHNIVSQAESIIAKRLSDIAG